MEIAIYCGKTYSIANACNKASGNMLDADGALKWVSEKGAGSGLVFGTDVVPYALFNYKEKNWADTPIFKYIARGGVVVWVGDAPFRFVEINGEKTEAGLNVFPIRPVGIGMKINNVESTAVGAFLSYNQAESTAPVPRSDLLIPLSVADYGVGTVYPAWIYRHGKGMLVRLFDTPNIDWNSVMSVVNGIEMLGSVTIIRLKNYRKFSNSMFVLPKAKVGVVLGRNDVGKSSLLEAIALLDESNRPIVEKIREMKDTGTVELFTEWSYFRKDLSKNENYPGFLLITPSVTPSIHLDPYSARRVAEVLRGMGINISEIYIAADGSVRVVLTDGTDVPLAAIGRGYKSITYLASMMFEKRPRVLLIDEPESFSLRPDVMTRLLDFIVRSDADLILISTQSGDVNFIVPTVATQKNIETAFLVLGTKGQKVLTLPEAVKLSQNSDLRFLVD